MSRLVIRDIVIPVVQKLLRMQGVFKDSSHGYDIRDPALEEFMEEQLSLYFGICGKRGKCRLLREQLELAKKNDPIAFENLINELLNKYLKLAINLRQALESKIDTSPPDRFKEMKKRAKEIWRVI